MSYRWIEDWLIRKEERREERKKTKKSPVKAWWHPGPVAGNKLPGKASVYGKL